MTSEALIIPSRETPLNRMMVWVCGTLLGLLCADAVIGSYNVGLSPLKPSLFTFGAVFVCVALALLNRPKFVPVSLLVLLLPMLRLFDAAVLERMESTHVDQVGMDLLRVTLVLMAILAVLATDQGLRAMRWAAVLAILLTTGSEVYEMLGFAKFTSIQGRYSGFNSHPNFPPMVLCAMLGIVFALSKNFRFNCLLIAVAVVGVALTYGRAGFAVLAVMSAVYILFNARKNLGFLLLIAAVAIPAAGLGFAVLQKGSQQGGVKDKNISERIEAIYKFDLEKVWSPERAKDLSDAWEAVMKRPLFGYGTGVSGTTWAPHNEYVSIWLELGIPGILLFVGLLGVMVVRSVLMGGRAGYLLFAILAYTPAAQGRIETPHFCLAIATAAHLLWPRRYRVTM